MRFLNKVMEIFIEKFKVFWALVFVPIFALIINIILAEAQNVFGIDVIIISIVFLTITLIGATIIYNKLFKEHTEKHVMPRLEIALSQFPAETNNADCFWEDVLVADRNLAEYERNCKCEEIWVISNDLSTELDGGLYADIVPANLKKGVKYKIFAANSNTVSMRIEQLKRKNQPSENIEYYVLDDNFFFLVARFDFTIYDPYKTAATGRIGYIGLDLPDNEELVAAKVNDNLVDAIASKLLEYIQHSKLQQK